MYFYQIFLFLFERENNNKENKLLQFFCDELNKKKEIIRNLDNKIILMEESNVQPVSAPLDVIDCVQVNEI